MAMTMQLRRLKRGDITVHGFRSTFRDRASEQISFPHEICEHAPTHRIAAAANRGLNIVLIIEPLPERER